MKVNIGSIIFGCVFLLSAEQLSCQAKCDTAGSRWFWGFDRFNETEGWTIPDSLNGKVSGGALWITIRRDLKKESGSSWQGQIWGTPRNDALVSPRGLKVPAGEYNQVVIRLINLSPETDGYVYWTTAQKPGVDTGAVHFTMKPDCREWQEVVCHMDDNWKGTIDLIKIQPAQMWNRGDIWIDWIAVTRGEFRMERPRPDICSDNVVPQIRVPGISQEDFSDAFRVLDECIVTDVPLHGFNYPFMAPGGAYGSNWWQLDGNLNVAGAKWANQEFVEDIIRGFAEVQAQNPDGRIDLWGGSTIRGQVADVSSLPRYFEAAYDVARRSDDTTLQDLILVSMKKYLEYWFSPAKIDRVTGLITGVFEETFSNPYEKVGSVAPVDLNVAVAVGCYFTGRLAEYLGNVTDAKRLFGDFRQLAGSINRYLWSDEDHVYYNYLVREKRHDKRLLCTTFDPLLLGIAPTDRVEKLIPVLLDPSCFNWGKHPLTTIARTEPGFVEATGTYDGRAWFGDIWTLRNLPVINGLEDAGKHDLAAELAWSTIKTFNRKYCEFIVPSTGSGEGVQRYGWSASQYIQTIIENLFGIDYDLLQKRLLIIPHIPDELQKQEIEIRNLKLPSEIDLRLDLKVLQKKPGKAVISLKLEGKLPCDMLEICLPSDQVKRVTAADRTGKRVVPANHIDGLKGVTGVRLNMADTVVLTFE